MMKNNKINKKKKKKDRTWAEAATMALQMSSKKVDGIKEILQTIFYKNLKEISLDKPAENVLATMLKHHAQLPNCPFFRVKGRNGLYALKSSWLMKQGEAIPPEVYKYERAEIDSVEGAEHSNTDEMLSPDVKKKTENHEYSIQGKSLQTGNNKKYVFPSSLYRKKNSLLRPSSIHGRRHSSPMKLPFHSRSINSRRPPIITRASSLTSRYANANHHSTNHVKTESNFDLESPGSVLVNANMRALVNKETFSMLPPSYRYKLTQLLPECDQILYDVGLEELEEHKIFAPSQTALTNEFFTQAVQEWRERLTDGEFTRETQSRIVQEIAKERSKIEPWKEQFFEEYYGQKKVSNQRLRIRSQNVAAEAGHKMRDLGMEAQLAIFAHLRPELEENYSDECGSSDSALQISEDDDDVPLQNLVSNQTGREGSPANLAGREGSPANSGARQKPRGSKLVSSGLSDVKSSSPITTTSVVAVKASSPKPAKPAQVSSPSRAVHVSSASMPSPRSAVPVPVIKAPSPRPALLVAGSSPLPPKAKRMSYVEKIAKTKLENSKILDKPLSIKESPSGKVTMATSVTSLVMRPSWSVGALPLSHNRVPTPPTVPPQTLRRNKSGSILNVQKQSDGNISDHSYSSTSWKKTSSSCTNQHRAVSTCVAPRSSSTTLVLFPNGQLVQSTIAHLQRPDQMKRGDASKKFEDLLAKVNSNDRGNNVRKMAPLVTLKPGMLTSASSNPDTERVLSLCARPLTPESFVSGGSKSVGVISNVTRQAPSPLLSESSFRDCPLNQQKRATTESILPPTKSIQGVVDVKDSGRPINLIDHRNIALTKTVDSRVLNVTCALSLSTTAVTSNSKITSPSIPSKYSPRFPATSYYNLSTTLCTMSHSFLVTSSAITHSPHLHAPRPSSQPSVFSAFSKMFVPSSPTIATVNTLPSRPSLLISQPPVSHHVGFTNMSVTTNLTPPSSHSRVMTSAPMMDSTFHSLSNMSTAIVSTFSPTLNSEKTLIAPLTSLMKKEAVNLALEKSMVVKQKSSLTTAPSPSSVASSRPQVAGTKRQFSASPSPLSTSPARFTASSSSPSPLKKARTLAEIKAQMKAKRAAAGGRPPLLQQPGMTSQQSMVSQQSPVVTNTSSHMFSATTFPVYFRPTVSDPLKLSMNHMATPQSASYIRLPPTGNLSLEKVQWVSHQGIMGVQGGASVEPSKPTKDVPPATQLPVVEQQNPSVTSSCTSSVNNKQKKPGKGKITLKIKAAGAAISLKVDADVIKKEMKRAVRSPSSDDDESSDDTHSDDSDRPKLFKHHHRGPIKLPKVGDDPSDSDSDLEPRPTQRWSATASLDTGQNHASSNQPHLIINPPAASLLANKSQPVFGVSPFSVSITPGSAIMTSSTSNNLIKESMFQSSPLFTSATSNAWNSRKVSPTLPSKESTQTVTGFPHKSGRVFRSNSKGKDMENMQKLARDNLFPSDDSAESSFDDDDHVDSTFSTSASEKGSDSDDDIVPTPVHRQAKVDCKRHTRSSLHVEENKLNSLGELASNNSTT